MVEKSEGNILDITRVEQYRTVDELFEKSKPNSVYYTLLILSSLMVAAGLLLANDFVLIGGLLITPVLAPVLLIALGIAVGELGSIRNVMLLALRSFLVVIFAGLALALIFGPPENLFVFEGTMRNAALYFIVAVASGIVATFAWARKEMASILPSIALAVSLAPPLSLFGIAFSSLNFEVARFYFYISLFNFIGILIGSLTVFALLQFYRAKPRVEEEIKKEEEEEIEKKEKEEEGAV